MITLVIEWSLKNRAMVLLLTAMLVAASIWAVFQIKLDAIPDLSDAQVIIRTEYMGQSPQIIEDQVTYPLARAMLSVPYAKVVRGYSMFGMSFVYIIFEDGTDIYWARSRVLEQLSFVSGKLPAGVSPQLGPDATGVGWVYEYALNTGKYCPKHPQGIWHDPKTNQWFGELSEAPIDEDVRKRLVRERIFDHALEKCPLDGSPLVESHVDLSELRSLQDWYLRYELSSLSGVSEVATIGGFEKQYQIVIDPIKLQALNLSLQDVSSAIARSNNDMGGRVLEQGEREFVVTGKGYLGRLSSDEQAAVQKSGMTTEQARTQKVLAEIRQIALGATEDGSPISLSDVAQVRVGPELRRGILDWNGQGDAVGGIIVMRYGENARTTIKAVQGKLDELQNNLPPGVAFVTGYDRSDLIDRAVHTLTHTLIEEITVVALVCILFLLHARSELVAVCVVPTGVLVSILIMHLLGINANVMSLGGIAIAIGVMVDSAIVMVENAHKHLDRDEERLHAMTAANMPAIARPRTELMRDAAVEVGPSLFFSLLIITVSFLPVFVLGQQSGRLFKPLAFTKTFAIAAAAVLSITLIPVLMSYLITSRVLPKQWGWLRNTAITLTTMLLPAAIIMLLPWDWISLMGVSESDWHHVDHWIAIGWVILSGMLLVPQRILHENVNPLSRLLQWMYQPFFILAMRFRWLILFVALLLVVSVIYPLKHLGSEFMPPLDEGDLLYMPTTDPGISVTKARELLQQTDRILKQFPEVKSVYGKAGFAQTATDPAPINMFETLVTLERDESKWRQIPEPRFFDSWPNWSVKLLEKQWPRVRKITTQELVYGYELPGAGDQGASLHVPGMNEVLQIPGLTNSWTMPIKTRIDMLSTGIKTPVGVKVLGPDLQVLGDLSEQIAHIIKTSDKTGPFITSVFSEKSSGGNYLDIEIDRAAIARYGLTVADVQDVIASALGGLTVTQTIEGLERYSVIVRYPSELRDNVPLLKQVRVPLPARLSGSSEIGGTSSPRSGAMSAGGSSGNSNPAAGGGMSSGGGSMGGSEKSSSGGAAAMGAKSSGTSSSSDGSSAGNSTGSLGASVTLGELAHFISRQGPDMIKSENARRTVWVYVDLAGVDVGTFVASAQQAVREKVQFPAGYSVIWSGEYEYMLTARKRLMVVVPVTLLLIVVLLYGATQSWLRVGIVMLAIPFSLVGALWFVYAMGYHLSLAVWVGVIALAGLDAETGLVMLLYLDNSFERYAREGRMRDANDLWHAIHDGAVMRIRPKTMTVAATFIGLVPLLWSHGAGADTMRRLAVPMIGGLTTSFILELLIYPVLFYLAKRVTLGREKTCQ